MHGVTMKFIVQEFKLTVSFKFMKKEKKRHPLILKYEYNCPIKFH